MVQYQSFPRSNSLLPQLQEIVECFIAVDSEISSPSHNLSSDEVLAVLRPHFENIGLKVESSKRSIDKIKVPVLFGKNNTVDRSFEADAVSGDGSIVIEVEAGRATENYQFLKDIFQACLMHRVEYLVIAVRNRYRTHNDFEIVYSFLDTLYVSGRITLPLKGIVLVGY
jgi:hypothetical protein